MPPRKSYSPPSVKHVSNGVGPIAGLQCWLVDGKLALVDTTPMGAFAQDVELWNSSLGLKESVLKYLKDACTK